MLYTSGTTGRPKGVYRRQHRRCAKRRSRGLLEPGETDVCLCTGPAYHAAPLAFNVAAPLSAGVGVVLMDRWDAEETLRLIERHRITHTHMVATMFHRLLSLPEAVRTRYDLSSLRYVIHGAAPTPVHEKGAMIEWLGPDRVEYYAATEGGGDYFVTAQEWLQKPGTVGRSPTPELTRCSTTTATRWRRGNGYVLLQSAGVGRFEYFKAPEKTSRAIAATGSRSATWDMSTRTVISF